MNIKDLPKGSYTPVAPAALNIKNLPEGSYSPVAPAAPPPPTPKPGFWGSVGGVVKDLGIGVAKGAGETLQNIGNVVAKPINSLFNKVTGQNQTVGFQGDALKPTNTAQTIGKTGERVAEFLAPVGAVSKAQKAIDVAVAGKGILPAIGRVAAKTGVEATAAGGVTLAQSADPKQAGLAALTAGVFKGGTGAVGEVLRGVKLPERLYSQIFKNTFRDVKDDFRTGTVERIRQKEPELYKTLVDNGIVKVGENGTHQLDETLARQALDRGLKGSLPAMAGSTARGLLKNELTVQTIAKSAKELVNVSEPQFESVLRQIGKQYKDVGFGEFAQRAEQLAKKVKAGTGSLSVEDALDARRLLDGLRAHSSFGETSPTLSLGQKNLKYLADALRSRLAKVPGMGDAMKEYTFNIDALEALSKEAARRGNNQVVGLIDSVLLGGGMASANPVAGGAIFAARKALTLPRVTTNIAQKLEKSGNITKSGAGLKALIGGTANTLQQ